MLQASPPHIGNSPDRETRPQTTKANVLVDSRRGSTESLARSTVGVKFGNHDVGRMRDDSAENTSEVTTREGNTSLSSLGVVGLLAWKTVVDHFDDGLEGGELHHGVWDLTTPEWGDALVETGNQR